MKKQLPLGYSPAYGYPSASRTPQVGSNGGSGVGGSNLPSIFNNPVIIPRPKSGLKLDVKGLHSTGLFLSNAPRERQERGGVLASSDPTAERIRQAQQFHALHRPRHHTSNGRLLHQKGSHPTESIFHREKALSGVGSRPPASIVRRQPSATIDSQLGRLKPSTLPPIGAESESCDSHVTTEGGEEEEESVLGDLKVARGDEGSDESNCTSDDSESDTDDEVTAQWIIALAISGTSDKGSSERDSLPTKDTLLDPFREKDNLSIEDKVADLSSSNNVVTVAKVATFPKLKLTH